MLASKLLIAVCDTEIATPFVMYNRNGSIVSEMATYGLGYKHVCGELKNEKTYLLSDIDLVGITPDALFEHATKKATDRIYVYLIEDGACVMTRG